MDVIQTQPNPLTPEPSSGGPRNTLLTLASILVLAGVVGVTLFLYLQNRVVKKDIQLGSKDDSNTSSVSDKESAIAPTMTQDEQKKTYGNIECRRFTSVEEALEVPSIACTLDLSGQNLTSLPEAISSLDNLSEINLSNNNFAVFPKQLISLSKLAIIDISNNKISTLPQELKNLKSLQVLNVDGTQVNKSEAETILKSTTHQRVVSSN